MKTMSRMFQISLVALIFFVVPSLLTVNRAEAKNMAADYKIEFAKASLERGDMDRAINDFKEVLLIDPSNEEAKAQLRKLGLKDDVFMAVSKTQTNSLVERVGEYREKVAMLETQKAQIERKLSEIQSQKESLSRANLAKDVERDLLQEKIDLLTRHMPKQEQAEFKQFVADQKSRQRQLAAKPDAEMTFAEKEAKLNDIKEKFTRMAKEAPVYEHRLTALTERYGRLSRDTFNQNADQDHIVQVLEDYLYFKKQVNDQLNNEGLAKAQSYSAHEKMMLAKMQELLALHESVGKYIKFMEAREDSIRKNNSLIATIRNEMTTAQFDSTKPDAMTKAAHVNLVSVHEDLQKLKQEIHQAQMAD